MRTKQKFLALIIALILQLSIIPTTALAVDEKNGTCGDNVTWSFDETEGTLTISGSGAMADYSSGGSVPWAAYKNSIAAVIIDSGVTSIGERAFMGCSVLSSLTIPDTVTSIKTNALHSCTALENLMIGKNVNVIVQPGIYLDNQLVVTVEDGNEHYAAIDNILYELYADGTAAVLQAAKSDELTAITVDTITANGRTYTITELKSYALSGLGELTSATLGDSITKIGPSAFYGCSKLSDVTMPAVEEIGASAFSGCTALSNIAFPETLRSMGDRAFKGCSFTSIKFPDSLEEIVRYTFEGCSQLQTVQFGTGLKKIGTGSFNGGSLTTVDTTRIAGEFTVEGAWVGNTISNYVIYFSKEQDAKDKYKYNNGNIIYEASQPHTIRAVTNDGIFRDGTVFANNVLSTPYKENFQFMGWFTQNGTDTGNLGEELVGGVNPIPQTVIYYAKWEPCIDHTYSNPAWNWAKDYSTATVTVTCTKCNSEQSATAAVTSAVTKEPTCTENGEKSYTAAVTINDQSYTDTKAAAIAATGHIWDEGKVTTSASYTAPGEKTFTCTACGAIRTESIPQLVYTPSGSSSASSVSTGYPVTASNARNGTVSVSPRHANKGTTVTITAKPNDGYQLDTLTVTDKDGKSIKVTEGVNNKYTFTMPAGKVTVEASFTKIEEAPKQNFSDVPNGYWAEDAIAWAAENSYINGNTAATFNPEGTVTRQQLWMILARLSGEQPADFTEAKDWAVSNWLSDGTNPGAAVSRQQLVTILYRYAVGKGYDTADKAGLSQFPDEAAVAAYAREAMGWSVANSIVGGTTQGTLAPNGTATRAQFATILMRFADKMAK